MSLNKAMIIGRLGQDPETRGPACSFSVATTETWNDKSGAKQEKTEWHSITAFGKTGELAQRYLTKGRQVYLEGRIQTDDWTDKQGNKRKTTKIIASTIEFLGSKGDSGGGGYDPASDAGGVASGGFDQSFNDDDIPF